MINRVHLMSVSVLSAVLLLAGCGPSKSSSDVNNRYGSFNHLESELNSLRATLAPESNFNGTYNPIEDQLGSACSMLAKAEDVPEELRSEVERLPGLEKKLHEVYNGPDASKESMMAVVDEMQAIIDKIKESGL